MPKKGVEPVRREQLIRATFQTIDEIGMADATVATIAKKAGLSSGIVAHYFGDKDGLLNAAMRQILRELKSAVARFRDTCADDPRAQLRAIVDGNFDDSQTNGTAMRVFASPWSAPAWMKSNNNMLQGGSLLATTLEYPVTDINNQLGLLQHTDKVVRRDGTALRVLPTQQGFKTRQTAAKQINLWLKAEAKLLLRQGLAQFGFQLQPVG